MSSRNSPSQHPDRQAEQDRAYRDSGRAAGHGDASLATAMPVRDTASFLAWSRAVSPLVGNSLRQGDVDSATGRSTRPTTRGTRTSILATRTTGTRTTETGPSSSAEPYQPAHAAFSFAELHQAYYDCRRRKRFTDSALRFEINLERNICELQEELLSGNYWPGRSICFAISHPKFREVYAADFRDRIVHHLFYNRIAPRFERAFSVESCACIKGRGTLYAIKRLDKHTRSITQNWTRGAFYLKCDLSNFFNHIDKRILWRILQDKIHEPWWLDLAGRLLWHDPRQDFEVRGDAWVLDKVPAHKRLTNQPDGFGLPIGNLPSQFLANVILDRLDQRIKHYIKARYYVRYVDDFVVLGRSPGWLNAVLFDINMFLPTELNLELNSKKTVLQPVDRGIDFVGQVIKPHHRLTRRRVVRHALHRIRTTPASELFDTANSYLGILRQATHSHCDRVSLCRALWRRGRAVNGALTKTYRMGA